ncbi:MAG: undecaprenyl-diphosphate phosphatase [Akkermansiaceae bacterium]|jgi:undecaprenyl-diphosphatase|nr:undecaprenyl-diphosphate phosphatase [Akkermansiaceae bacterium]
MNLWQALVLGVIEGVTEYLPISSTGHLVVAQQLMGVGTRGALDKAAADAFAICIQGGAILAVLGLYWPHVMKMLRGVLGRDPDGLRLATRILIGFLPAAVLGLALNDLIDAHLMFMWPIIFAWVVGGVAILVVGRWRRNHPATGGGKDLLAMTWQMALLIGLMQCVAMWPGTSRSLMTIVGGLVVGLSVRAAVEYSFLLGVLTLTAATCKKAVWKVSVEGAPDYDAWLGGARLMWDSYGALPTVAGLAAAAISAAIAVKWLVSYLQSHGLAIFGWYRIGVGLLVAALVLGGVVTVTV